MTGELIIKATENGNNTQQSILKVISTNKSSDSSTWTGRTMLGAEDLTFLLGTYKGMAGIGAHNWQSAANETGSSWAPIYIQPDNSKPIYLGANGPGWTPEKGTLIVQGSTTEGEGIITANGSLILNGTLNGGIPYTTTNKPTCDDIGAFPKAGPISLLTSYPTNGGSYRTGSTKTGEISANVFQNLSNPGSYGNLFIFKAGYGAHFYLDMSSSLFFGRSSDTFSEPTNWYQIYTTKNLKSIFGKAIDLSTGEVKGKGTFYGTYNSTPSSRFTTSALEIRENGLVSNNENDIGYAPSIGFHWGNQGAGTLFMHANQVFYFRKQDGVTRATIDANLNGNAETATTSTYVSTQNAVANSFRHVFFAYDTDPVEKRRIVCNDNFKYNPSTNTLTVGKINGSVEKLSATTAGYWHNQTGVLARKYEGENTTTYNIPNAYCTVLTMTQGGNRGSAIALDWRNNNNNIYFNNLHDDTGTWKWGTWRRIWCEGNSVTGAVWNDYAECREADTIEPGYVLVEIGDDTLTKSTKRMQPFAGVSSDTWGFSQGETTKAKTPIAVAGRVLVYPFQERENYKPGDCVCAAPNGTVDIMTEEEIYKHPDRIVGTVSCVPTYEEWGGGENADRDSVKVNGRIWIKVR